MIIAIDGPAASGKGTIAKRVAAHYGLAYLDTGMLYRAVARDTLARSRDPADADEALNSAKALDPSTLGDPGLRKPGLAEAASLVAKHPEVREELLAYQRSFARAKSGAVLDGRDIGTVICPDADVKLFVTATPEERARRRYLELKQAGIDVSEAEVLGDIRRRDERDKHRAASPLRQAPDAHLLDTTNLDIDAAFKAAIDLIDAALARAGYAG
jgi:CMP/dCMP kinase